MDTTRGRLYAEWDDQSPVTREGQLMIFFQFLHAGGRWEEFLRQYPLHYTGNRGSGAPNVRGTAMLSILCGHWRYSHINAVRGDGINPGLLGMKGVVSEELQDIRAITERWTVTQCWTLLLTRVLRRWLGKKWLPGLPDDAKLLLSG